jgi:hypothetical protein
LEARRKAEKGCSSSLEVRRKANNSSPYKFNVLRTVQKSLELGQCLWHDVSNDKWTGKPNRDPVTGDWRRLHNEELHDLCYSSPNSIRVIKSRRMRWAGHVARVGESRGAYRVLVGRYKGKRPV